MQTLNSKFSLADRSPFILLPPIGSHVHTELRNLHCGHTEPAAELILLQH